MKTLFLKATFVCIILAVLWGVFGYAGMAVLLLWFASLFTLGQAILITKGTLFPEQDERPPRRTYRNISEPHEEKYKVTEYGFGELENK